LIYFITTHYKPQPTMFGQTKSTSPPAQDKRTTSPTTMTPRHAELESSFPAAFFRKRKSSATAMTAPVEETESERRMSVSSTATTATTSSISSDATTIAAPAQSISEKEMGWYIEEKTEYYNEKQAAEEKQKAKKAESKPFDVFEYQAAGYLSMPMDHESQPYRNSSASKAALSSRKSSSSSSSSQSLWTKTKNLAQRRGSGQQQRRNSAESEEEKQQKKKEYEEFDLEKKTKFGLGEGAGMRMVG
jgi:hypothetical protein